MDKSEERGEDARIEEVRSPAITAAPVDEPLWLTGVRNELSAGTYDIEIKKSYGHISVSALIRSLLQEIWRLQLMVKMATPAEPSQDAKTIERRLPNKEEPSGEYQPGAIR